MKHRADGGDRALVAVAAGAPAGRWRSTGSDEHVLTALILGAVASAALVIGAVVAVAFDVPDRILALALALAAGSLMAAVAFELFEPAARTSSAPMAATGLLAGAMFFTIADRGIDRYFDPSRGRGQRGGHGASILLAVVVDGVPESIALGATVGASGGSPALVAAIFLSNLPEAMNGSNAMRTSGRSATWTIGVWAATGVLLTGAAVLGNATLSSGDDRVSIPLSLAAGGVIASLADTLMPNAYRRGGSWVALATATGFALAYLLTAS